MSNFEKVKGYLLDLGHEITQEIEENSIFVINDEQKGICNMVLECEGDVLTIEQGIFNLVDDDPQKMKRLLQINRNLVHGAFVLDQEAKNVIFRDTLQLENLDLNEIEASLNALSLALVEHMDELLVFSGEEAPAK